MEAYIAFDVHKRYTLAEREGIESRKVKHHRIEHEHGAIREYLKDVEPGTTVAMETVGNWYWIADEVEAAGCRPALVHALKAKLMMGQVNKTDKLDVHGLNRLQRVGTLPTVWIPPAEVRDKRELPRTRMFLVEQRSRLRNRIQAELTKYGLNVTGFSDPFGVGAREAMAEQIKQLPRMAALMTEALVKQHDFVNEQVKALETEITQVIEETPEVRLLMTLPGVGRILSVVMALEIGDVSRFGSGPQMASYAGVTPRVHSSGDKTRYGRMRQDVNRYLKWAFNEAATCICLNRRRDASRHVSQLYERLVKRKGYKKTIGAVSRHLAEAAYHVLSKGVAYREPGNRTDRSTGV